LGPGAGEAVDLLFQNHAVLPLGGPLANLLQSVATA